MLVTFFHAFDALSLLDCSMTAALDWRLFNAAMAPWYEKLSPVSSSLAIGFNTGLNGVERRAEGMKRKDEEKE